MATAFEVKFNSADLIKETSYKSLTEKEAKLVNAFVEAGYNGCGATDFRDLSEDNYCWMDFSDITEVFGNEKTAKGVLGSLEKKFIVDVERRTGDTDLYCLASFFVDEMAESETKAAAAKEEEATQEVLEIMEEVKEEMVEENNYPEHINATKKEVKMETLKSKQTKGLKVDPLSISFDNENNPRKDYGDQKSLERFIKENGAGALPAIKVRKTSEGELELVHGYRRMNAISKLIEKGNHPGLIKVDIVLKSYTEQDELLDHLTDNEGKNLTPFEQAFIYKALEEQGMSQKEIRQRTGKSRNHITWMLRLAKAPKTIHDAIIEGKISTSLATDFINKFKDDAEKMILKAIADIEALGGTKVTPKEYEKAEKEAGKERQHKFIKRLHSLEEVEGRTKKEKHVLSAVQQIIEAVNEVEDDEELLQKLVEITYGK